MTPGHKQSLSVEDKPFAQLRNVSPDRKITDPEFPGSGQEFLYARRIPIDLNRPDDRLTGFGSAELARTKTMSTRNVPLRLA
ncbi:hypothetical protein [Actinopolymorpha pittospori]|uniref:Uncharacterized protein n=1 Tax=Actinopolymorpha pittospori TaxID=648752 RepID=A0A927MQT4_9ACTN|nr:hypothetical protein [Actinopolymorpha pittospori]MBE1605180.1 hypothetical protein [Actinopolymorpha pittospori]